MTDQTITATPVNAPDILRNAPLTRQVDIRLETTILEPVSHNYTSNSNTNRTVFQLPAKGVLDAPNAALVFEVNDANGAASCFTYSAGGLGMINRITCRCGGNILSQVENAGQYATIKSNYLSHGEKVGIHDSRHLSSSEIELRVAQGKIATTAATLEFQQLNNPECDQVSSIGRSYNGNAANTHQTQVSKCFNAVAGRGAEVVIKLADLFEFFAENRLPLLAMALVEIEIEWAAAGDANAAGPPFDIIESPVIDSLIPTAAADAAPQIQQAGVITMTTPNLILDYIHYDDAERQKIFDAINTQGGMRLDFTEVLITRGVNPASSLAPGGGTGVEVIKSNHILGMSQKEVKKIYIQKNYDIQSTVGAQERDADFTDAAANIVWVKTHRNILKNQFKSQQILGESYNWFINNARVYDKDIDSPAVQHNYLSQVGGHWTCPHVEFNTSNYNANACKTLLDSQYTNGVLTGLAVNQGMTQRYLAGSNNFIGLSLDKYRELGSIPGNGTRIGSAPIEFSYSRVCQQTGAAASGQLAEVNLIFYICYRRSLIIRQLGVDVSDA